MNEQQEPYFAPGSIKVSQELLDWSNEWAAGVAVVAIAERITKDAQK